MGEAEAVALGEATVTLRTSLHLNAAAAALRESEWEVASTACSFVLRQDPANVKALYRLAQVCRRHVTALWPTCGEGARRKPPRDLPSEMPGPTRRRTEVRARARRR